MREHFGINDYIGIDGNRMWFVEDQVTNESIPEEYARILSGFDSINIMYSGGIDSEIVAEVCRDYAIPHQLHFVALVHEGKIFNRDDYDNAKKFSSDLVVHELNFSDFFESSEYIDYALKYGTMSPQLACHFRGAEEVGQNVIFGGDSMYFRVQHEIQTTEFATTTPSHFSYDRVAKEFGGIGNMANASYSLLIKYLQIQLNMAKEGNFRVVWDDFTVNMQQASYPWKCEMYRRAGFKSLPKQNKLTGFEAIKQYYSDKYNEIGTCRKFDHLYRAPLQRIVKIPSGDNLILSLTNQIKDLLNEFGETYDKGR